MRKGNYEYHLESFTERPEPEPWRRHWLVIYCSISELNLESGRRYTFVFTRTLNLGEGSDLQRPRVAGAYAELVRGSGEVPIMRRHRAEQLAYHRCRKLAAAQLRLAFRWLDEPIAAYLALSGRDDAISLAM